MASSTFEVTVGSILKILSIAAFAISLALMANILSDAVQGRQLQAGASLLITGVPMLWLMLVAVYLWIIAK